ncbi:flavodoxin family protein [Luteipulveratus mongoliensis]|uniref:Flavodoxin n=1 Tax=Luteipulveratus mongoliensis TaxID=571913 RepID=A0A0K1JMJ1_9MICO|nr:flavodoxin family protein [Luteipulveratus mongoliensis]AKU17934.1 flavodoxin [Luteipulveratus mongoliensis]
MSTLLVLHHSPTPLLRRLLDAVLDGARDDAIEGVAVRVVAALDVTIEDFLTADGYLLGTPANFGYMSGALKHAFDSTYDDVRGRVGGRPFSFWIHGRSDTTGARRAVESITTGLEWRLVAEPVEVLRQVEDLDPFVELGGTLAAVLMES